MLEVLNDTNKECWIRKIEDKICKTTNQKNSNKNLLRENQNENLENSLAYENDGLLNNNHQFNKVSPVKNEVMRKSRNDLNKNRQVLENQDSSIYLNLKNELNNMDNNMKVIFYFLLSSYFIIFSL